MSLKHRAHELTEANKIARRDRCRIHVIDTAVGEWRKRLGACVAAGGGQFEHKM